MAEMGGLQDRLGMRFWSPAIGTAADGRVVLKWPGKEAPGRSSLAVIVSCRGGGGSNLRRCTLLRRMLSRHTIK